MDFLDKLVLPQSLEHIQLLHYMMMLVLFLYIPFTGMLMGGLSLSLFFKRKAKSTGNPFYLRLSSEVIRTVTVKKTAGVILAMLPPFVLTFIGAQILHQLKIAATGYLFFGALLGVPAVILVYIYRYSLEFKGLFKSMEGNKEVDSYFESASDLNRFTGPWGMFMMISSTYFVIAGISLGIYSNEWEASKNLLHIFASGSFFIKWLYLFAFGFAVTSIVLLFRFFYWDGGIKDESGEYKEFAREKFSKIAMLSAFVLPLLILIHTVQIPASSLSKTTLMYSAIAALLLFGLFHSIYEIVKKKNMNATSWALLFVVFSAVALILGDQSAFKQSTKMNSIALSDQYDSTMKQMLAATGAAEISGEAIFQQKCQACHKWDVKLVGPPYKETLPKYEGKLNELYNFIGNPVKVNPAYPPMPAQGLKPKEVKAVAKYIMENYKTK
ncbi:MAG: c-type cytochrome [Ignavibacteria bacterium]|nr:c-type cytochrome [Ignavibacteria bacterium]